MWEFIVSGRLPGTAIQITFESWLIGMAGMIACLMLHVAIQRGLFGKLFLKLLVLYAIVLTSFDSRDLRI